METTQIGSLEINYNEDGTILSASFNPQIKIEVDNDLQESLKTVVSSTNETIIKENADTLMAALFNRINDIELTDRTNHVLKSKVKDCERWDNKTVKKCVIDYWFEKVK